MNHGLYCHAYKQFLDDQLLFKDYYSINVALNLVRNTFDLSEIHLELLLKQRIRSGEIMSTLPLGELMNDRWSGLDYYSD